MKCSGRVERLLGLLREERGVGRLEFSKEEVPKIEGVIEALKQGMEVRYYERPEGGEVWIGIGEKRRWEFKQGGGEVEKVWEELKAEERGIYFIEMPFEEAGTGVAIVPEVGLRWGKDGGRVEGKREKVKGMVECIWGREREEEGSSFGIQEKAEIPGKEVYCEQVREGLEWIRGGEGTKVVLARRMRLRLKGKVDEGEILGRMREWYGGCTLIWRRIGAGDFVAATPELLLRIGEGGSVIETEAVAGTYWEEGGGLKEKEEREHECVVSGIREVLEGEGYGVKLGERGWKRVQGMRHLWTPMRGERIFQGEKGGGWWGIVEKLHPTGAIGGWPREVARAKVREIEGFERGYYGGVMGYGDLREGEGEVWVGLRCGVIEGGEVMLYGGAGIVEGSEPEREYEETGRKMGAMLRVFEGRAEV